VRPRARARRLPRIHQGAPAARSRSPSATTMSSICRCAPRISVWTGRHAEDPDQPAISKCTDELISRRVWRPNPTQNSSDIEVQGAIAR